MEWPGTVIKVKLEEGYETPDEEPMCLTKLVKSEDEEEEEEKKVSGYPLEADRTYDTASGEMSSNLQYIVSQRGGKQLAHKGYIYSLEKPGSGTVFWKCVEYKKIGCKGRVTTKNEEIYNEREHCHAPDSIEIARRKVVHQIKEEAATSKDTPANTVKAILDNVPAVVAGALSNTKNLKRIVKKYNPDNKITYKIPKTMDEVNLPESFCRGADGENILKFDNKRNDDRILIFTTDRAMNFAQTSDTWQVDGTFKVSPVPFCQVYTVHCKLRGETFPLFYALMQRKTVHSYTELFCKIRELSDNHSPKLLFCDFEQAAIAAFKIVHPQSVIQGSHFHWMQLIWRTIQEVGLQSEYIRNLDLQHNIKMLTALTFVPECKVIEYFDMLMESPFFVEQVSLLTPLLNYFEDTWVGRLARTGRRNPRFPISLWNCYKAVLDNKPHTNNKVEGWHNAFHQSVGIVHPNIYKFISKLHKEITYQSVQIIQAMSGSHAPKQSKKSHDHNTKIYETVIKFDTIPPREYLFTLAYNVQFAQ